MLNKTAEASVADMETESDDNITESTVPADTDTEEHDYIPVNAPSQS